MDFNRFDIMPDVPRADRFSDLGAEIELEDLGVTVTSVVYAVHDSTFTYTRRVTEVYLFIRKRSLPLLSKTEKPHFFYKSEAFRFS